MLMADRDILIWGNTWTVEDRVHGAAPSASTLFRVCKQIYRESEDILYKNTFLVDFFFTPIWDWHEMVIHIPKDLLLSCCFFLQDSEHSLT
jgi:hypothetical protein